MRVEGDCETGPAEAQFTVEEARFEYEKALLRKATHLLNSLSASSGNLDPIVHETIELLMKVEEIRSHQ